jgi:hypothetical protein
MTTMPNETREATSARTNHSLDKILLAKDFGTTIEVYRDDKDGQLKIAASYNIPGNSPSINQIDIRDLPLDDVREIMRVAIERMIAEACEGVIMELRSDRRTLFFV